MSLFLRVFLIVVSVAFFILVCFMVRREKLMLKYSLTWLVLSLLGVAASVFPQGIIALSEFLEFDSPANLVFVTVIAILLVICLMSNRALTRQSLEIKDLIQALSIQNARSDGDDSPQNRN